MRTAIPIITANSSPLQRPTINSLPIMRRALREFSSLVARERTTTASVCCPVVPPMEATIGITAKIESWAIMS